MVLRPGCHKKIDRLAPDSYPPNRLQEIKRKHEERSEVWATKADLDVIVTLVLASLREEQINDSLLRAAATDPTLSEKIFASRHTAAAIMAIAAMKNTAPFKTEAIATRLEIPFPAAHRAMLSLAGAGLISRVGRTEGWRLDRPEFWDGIS
jgi:hypothetical protein